MIGTPRCTGRAAVVKFWGEFIACCNVECEVHVVVTLSCHKVFEQEMINCSSVVTVIRVQPDVLRQASGASIADVVQVIDSIMFLYMLYVRFNNF